MTIVRKEIKFSWDSEILYDIVRDTTRTSEKHELIRVVSHSYPIRDGLTLKNPGLSAGPLIT